MTHQVRDRVRAQFSGCLGSERAAVALETCTFNVVFDDARRRGVAQYWENVAFRRLYTTKALSLLFNLRNPATPQLREDLLRATDAEPFRRLVRMTHQEMHPELWAPVFVELQRKAMRGKPHEVPDDFVGLHQCGRCRSWRTTFTLLQTRASDEPTTAFCLCHACGGRWKMNA